MRKPIKVQGKQMKKKVAYQYWK